MMLRVASHDPAQRTHRESETGRDARAQEVLIRHPLDQGYRRGTDMNELIHETGKRTRFNVGPGDVDILIHPGKRPRIAPCEAQGPVGENALRIIYVGQDLPNRPLPVVIGMIHAIGRDGIEQAGKYDVLFLERLQHRTVRDMGNVPGIEVIEFTGSRPMAERVAHEPVID